MSEERLRTIIDHIALDIAECDQAEDLQMLITAKTMDYIVKISREQPSLTEDEIDRITTVIVAGVLKRLAQIAESGGQIGSA